MLFQPYDSMTSYMAMNVGVVVKWLILSRVKEVIYVGSR